ncbi:MAG: oxygen sensor histidine kinase NreB [Bacteroidota bacterium]|jgi:signal transduction histidine kinase
MKKNTELPVLPVPSVQLLQEIHELERRAIASILTENVNQVLVMARMLIETALKKKQTQTKVLEDSSKLISDTINDLKYVTKKLQPGPMLELGLHVVLEDFLESLSSRKKVNFQTNWAKSMTVADFDRLHLVTRMIQEYLQMLVEFSKSKQINISSKYTKKNFIIQIEDDGIEIDKADEHVQLTLRFLSASAAQINGKKTISKTGELGRTFIISIPLNLSE